MHPNRRLASPSHIDKHCLPKMPAQNLIDRAEGILQELLIEMTTSEFKASGIRCEADNLIIILHVY